MGSEKLQEYEFWDFSQKTQISIEVYKNLEDLSFVVDKALQCFTQQEKLSFFCEV